MFKKQKLSHSLGLPPLRILPKWTAKYQLFWTDCDRALVFLDISRCLRDIFFYIVCVYKPLELPQIDLCKNHFLKAKFNKNSKIAKARNFKFRDMISLYMKLCTCVFKGATTRGLGQTHKNLWWRSLTGDFNNCFFVVYAHVLLWFSG